MAAPWPPVRPTRPCACGTCAERGLPFEVAPLKANKRKIGSTLGPGTPNQHPDRIAMTVCPNCGSRVSAGRKRATIGQTSGYTRAVHNGAYLTDLLDRQWAWTKG